MSGADSKHEKRAVSVIGEKTAPSDDVLCFHMAKDPRAWPAVSSVLKRNPSVLVSGRGALGESLMHWAAITDMSFVIDCLGLGGDASAVDSRGRLPIDWAVEKMFFSMDEASIGDDVKLFIREKMSENVMVLADVSPVCAFEKRFGEFFLFELALRSGSLAAAKKLFELSRAGLSAVSSGAPFAWLALGRWPASDERKAADWLVSVGFDPSGAVFGPKGMSVACFVAAAVLDGKAKKPMFDLVVALGANPDDDGPDGFCVFDVCASHDNPAECERVLGLS